MRNDLKLLPDLTFPLTQAQINPLLESVQKLNVLDAGVDPRTQKAIDIMLHAWDLKAKTGGRIDYTGPNGHARLYQDAVRLVPEFLATKHGDLRAAHLGIDFNNTQVDLRTAGMALLPGGTFELINMCRDILNTPIRTDERMSLLLSLLSKKTP